MSRNGMDEHAPRTATPGGAVVKQSATWPILAGVRFFMAIAVANYHLFVVDANGRLPLLGEFGALGCILGFLIISGYSIAHSISIRPRGFVRRRAWRILPIYYATMILGLAPYIWARGSPLFRYPIADFTFQQVAGSVVLAQTFLTEKIPIFGPSWTLAIEWWFYMMAPFFVRARARTLVALIATSIVGVYVALARFGYPLHVIRWGVPAITLLWAWLSGFFFYRFPGWGASAVLAVGAVVAARFPEGGTVLSYIVAAVAVMVVKAVPPIPRRLARFLEYLGDLSYPLYLVHLPLMLWVSHFFPLRDPHAYIALSLVGAAALHHGLEAPLRARFKERSRSAAIAVTAADYG